METTELGYVERIRALVGRNGWDYCVLWKLSSNQRSMELLGCLCGGFENTNTQLLEISATCRDAMLHHSRTRACDFLAEVPSYINLDSSSTGVYAHALLSNTPRWLFLSNTTINPSISDENVRATQVLVPIPGGLVELFAEKLVNEDQHVIEFIMSNFSTKTHDLQNQQLSSTTMINYLSKENNGTLNDNGWIPSPAASGQLSYLCNQIYTDHLRLSNPLPNDMDQVRNEAAFFEGSADSTITEKPFFTFKAMPENSLPRVYEQTILENCDEDIAPMMSKPKGSSASDTTNHGEDEDEYKSRGGKKPAKNLIAERNRREKLNSRLLRLRALVPNISKMDKAAIVVDAIDYVKELQEQVKTLQNELERTNFEEEGGRENVEEEVEHHHKYQVETLIQGRRDESTNKTDRHPKPFEEDNGQHKMEVQVEVCELGRNEFFVKVFCEHKFGGFVSLMEAINSLGLEVTNANVTTFRTLVLNVFKVEKRDNEVLEAEEVRSSLLELTGSSNSGSLTSNKRRKTDVQTLNYTYQHQPLAYQF